MIYDKNGNQLFSAYNKSGEPLERAYNKNGEEIFPENILKVMSYNVLRWDGYNSLKVIQDIAFGFGADLVGIQEWGYTSSKTIEGTNCETYLNGFGYSDIRITSDDYNHKALASKYQLSNYSETVYAASHETRSYTKAYFTFNNKQIAWFNTHTDYQEDNYKYNQIQELLAAVENEEYFIITGDLNTTCTDKNSTEYENCVQPFIDAGYNVANSPVGDPLVWTFYSGKTVGESSQITPPDNIITSANIEIVSVNTIDTKLSASGAYVIDHIPIVAILEVT